MKTTLTLFAALVSLALAGAVVGGCSKAEDSGIPATVTTELQGLSGAARTAGGDWTKLSEADKQKFIQRAGDEAGAKAMVTQMATRPNPSAGGGTPAASR